MNPLVLVVSDDVTRLEATASELRSRFARDYAVEVAPSVSSALDRLHRAADEGAPVAMVLADARADAGDGISFLVRVRALFPTAVRVALLARGDVGSGLDIRRAIALGRVDAALAPPVAARDEDFFSVVTEYLAEWAWLTAPEVEAVTVVGDPSSGDVQRLVDVLRRHGVPSGVHPPTSAEGRRVRALVPRDAALPLVQILDQAPLSAPTLDQVADAFGFARDVTTTRYDLAIVGGGPAGLGAAVYGASEGLSTLVVEQEAVGGQAGTSSMIRNYLGFPRGITGRRLASRALDQATRFGVTFHIGRSVVGLDTDVDGGIELRLSSGATVSARAVLLACGVTYRRLGVANIEALVDAGVFYGAASGAAHALEGLDAYVIGAGNSAGQGALHLARYAAQVTLVVRGPDVRRSMSDYLVKELEAHERVRVLVHSEVVDGGGEAHLEWLRVRNNATGHHVDVPAAGLFIMIGAVAHTDWLPNGIARDERGFVRTGADLPPDVWRLARAPMTYETSAPGVFAAGDVRAGAVKRVAAAVGEGAVAVPMIHAVLTEPSGASR